MRSIAVFLNPTYNWRGSVFSIRMSNCHPISGTGDNGERKKNFKDRKIMRKKNCFHSTVPELQRTGSVRPINSYRCHFPRGVTRRVVPKFEHITPWRVCLSVSHIFLPPLPYRARCHSEEQMTDTVRGWTVSRALRFSQLCLNMFHMSQMWWTWLVPKIGQIRPEPLPWEPYTPIGARHEPSRAEFNTNGRSHLWGKPQMAAIQSALDLQDPS